MSIRVLRPAALAALPFAAVALAAPAAAFAQAGATFTYRVQSSGATREAHTHGAAAPDMLATVRMAGGNARVDFRAGGMATTKPGAYVVIRGAERQFVLVNAQDRQAMVMSADGLGSGLGALTNNGLVKMTMRDPRFAYEDLGAGDRILGYPTRHVRVRSGSTMEVRVLGRTQRSTDSSTTELWIAQRPAGLDAEALGGWGRSFGGGVRRTNPELDLQMADYQRRYGDGLALRTLAISHQADDRGRARVDTIQSEVTELTRGRIDPAVFAVPADYQTVDTRQMATAIDSARRANGDTGSLGDAMRKAANESVRDNATAGVKDAVGGLFRRRRP